MRNMHSIMSILILGALLASPCVSAGEHAHDPAEVLAYQGDTVLTQSAIDGAFAQVPAEGRALFIRDREKVQFTINALLLNKKMAEEARAAGMDQDPLVHERLKLAVEKELALAWRERILEQAPEADYEAIAYEKYLANAEQFKSPETLDVSHILIKTDKRSDAEAAEIATGLAEQLKSDPGRFDEFVQKHSEDPSRYSNEGRFPEVQRGQMVAPFEKAAFAMQEPGEISEPVKSRFGYHIIRFNGRRAEAQLPFEDVRDRLVRVARKEHRERYRDQHIARLVNEPVEFPEGALEIMVKRHFGEKLERAPAVPGQGD